MHTVLASLVTNRLSIVLGWSLCLFFYAQVLYIRQKLVSRFGGAIGLNDVLEEANPVR